MADIAVPEFLRKEFPEAEFRVVGLNYLKLQIYLNGRYRELTLRKDTLESPSPRIQKWLIKQIADNFGTLTPPPQPDEDEEDDPSPSQDDEEQRDASGVQ